MDEDQFFGDLEDELNSDSDSPESITFDKWEERGIAGFHSKKKSYSDCRHLSKTLNGDIRMIQCDECKAYLDPFDALDRFIRSTENTQRTGRALSKELKELHEKVLAAKKELKSLNLKIKRRKNNIGKEEK